MKKHNELKVGLAIIIAIAVFVFGIRFFKDIPLFKGTNTYFTEVEDAKGLIAGNAVRVNGLKIGAVTDVELIQDRKIIRVAFRVNSDITVPEGTTCSISGIDALTGIRLDLALADLSNPELREGSIVPSADTGNDFISSVTARAPDFVNKFESVIEGLDGTIGQTQELLGNPEGDLRQALRSLRLSSNELTGLLRGERQRVSAILASVDTLTRDLTDLSATSKDSLARTISNLNAGIASMQSTMQSLDQTTIKLESILNKVNSGEGTLGKLVNDEALYVRMDSTLSALDALLDDFKDHPRKYLKDMSIIEIF